MYKHKNRHSINLNRLVKNNKKNSLKLNDVKFES